MPARQGASTRAAAVRAERANSEAVSRAERIRGVARKHFTERGYAATSMREVAADAGITISTLFFHCSSKEQLLFDVLTDSMEQLSRGLRDRIDAAGPAWSERLAAAIAFHVEFCAQQAFGTTINKVDMENLTAEHRAQYVGMRDEYERQFVDLLRLGMAAGEFRSVNVKLTAFAIIGVGLTVGRWYSPAGPLTPREIAAQYADLFLHALSEAPAASPVAPGANHARPPRPRRAAR